jgi:hypothetical protein
MAQIRQILKKKNSKFSEFYDKFQWVAKNIEGFWVCSTSYLVCSQIWLKATMDYSHFSYITKLKKKNPAGEIF